MELTACSSPIGQIKKPTQITINRVENGFILNGYSMNQKIANTLGEVLELARKELE